MEQKKQRKTILWHAFRLAKEKLELLSRLLLVVKNFDPIARTFDTQGEATSWAADIEREMRIGRYQDARPAEKITFSAALTRYLNQWWIPKQSCCFLHFKN